jgi:hypothetical protein
MDKFDGADDDFQGKYWADIFNEKRKNPVTLEMKVVLYLYLLIREGDYGYNISKSFKTAARNKKWENRTGLKDLLNPSKVVAALKHMADIGILLRYEDVKNKLPESLIMEDKIERSLKEHPGRKYYTVNHNVLFDLYLDTKTHDRSPTLQLENLAKGEVFLFNILLWQMLRFIQLYGKTEQEVIEFISRISKYDYLTILLTFDTIIHDLSCCSVWNSAKPENLDKTHVRDDCVKEYQSTFFTDNRKLIQHIFNINKKYPNLEVFSLDEAFNAIPIRVNRTIINAVRYERRLKKK